jgi:hypothetical protein
MRIRFLADADLHQVIVTAVIRREPGIDFKTAAGLKGLNDLLVLEEAAREDRVLISHDQSTMPDHFAEFIQQRESAGLLIVPQHLPHHLVVEEILMVWHASQAEEWVNRISYLPL